MEDAHIAIPELPNGCSLFGVFDGHGGIIIVIKVDKLHNMYHKCLLKSWQTIKNSRTKTMNNQSSKHTD